MNLELARRSGRADGKGKCQSGLVKNSKCAPTVSPPVSPFQKRHHVLQTAHPSPLSVYRGFFGCRHFSKTNELLQKSGKEPINWKDL